jgi:hypothetical protein
MAPGVTVSILKVSAVATSRDPALAVERPGDLAALRARLSLSEQELREMARIAAVLPLRQRADGVIIQCDHFEELEDMDFSTVWKDRSRPFGRAVTQERMDRSKCLSTRRTP